MLILLLGAVAPSTDAGTMAGKPAAPATAMAPVPAVARNSRREARRSEWIMNLSRVSGRFDLFDEATVAALTP
jgi:hypothetical protein